MELEEEIKNDVFNEPYFLTTNDQERFYAVRSVISKPDKANKGFNFLYTFNKNNELILGKDITEVPNRGLTILVEYPEYEKHLISLYAIIECQKLARLCLCDYSGLELRNGIYSGDILIPGYLKVQPRLFRKIIDN